MRQYTRPDRLLVEALVVAVGLVVLFYALHAAVALTGWRPGLALELAVTGAVFHVACEYSGVNRWYCEHRA